VKGGTLAHAFHLGKRDISGDINFDSENWTVSKTKPGEKKYNLFSVESRSQTKPTQAQKSEDLF